MHYLAEDPWPLGLVLGGVALFALLALRVTQQGKFLVVAVVAALLAVALFVGEAAWVTDDERVEAVVMDVARAAQRGDVDAVMDRIAPDVVLQQGGADLARGERARGTIRATLERTKFDFITINNMRAHADVAARSGTAEFRVLTMGSIQSSFTYNFATDAGGADWLFGFREAEPGVWKINRIDAVRLPGNAQIPLVTPSG
jgi:hypothetical protein